MSDEVAAVDMDMVCFRVAAAAEERSILAIHKTSGNELEMDNRTALKEFLSATGGDYNEYEIKDVQKAEMSSTALASVKNTANAMKRAAGAKKAELYIGGKDNFRDQLLLPKQYKANRADALRPLLLAEAREYAIKHLGAIVIDGMEADDMLAVRAWDGAKSKKRIIAVTNDKDQMGCTGWMFNPDKMEKPFFIAGLGKLYKDAKGKIRGFGRKWLYYQMIFGDPVDHYKPCELSGNKFGEVSAFNLLHPCTTDQECLQAVYNLYHKWHPEGAKYTAWNGVEQDIDTVAYMQLYFDVARMRRWENDQVDINELLDTFKVERVQ